ncbi:MAG TPA: 3'(2'),5'-bisphosphate nucleotidase CysQ [Candidatus Marinimicrobia bacterium]|jgi:myo-inositol-1(or 4)-monophosphatase|nr:3'(2'),5'-bisphosphate nucleotidase CysQ [Candidatus Neomarinimicrobiota bacterium]MDP6275349.1 3'(2'),5'-bisphosphate nucleotidase CysQ [Candidatus Neomarinimicrobiota bacterium]MDP7329665.1 3'(2'),5'-bisphosphate nucleotidase CysQ [Candidatus Neomarinimicrobiota bacterium]MDP7436281.1 3'(2'),5'-bisphosphate nucleotidase CysQ [Candidatus Neomarinimicrobiota bacterium]HBN45024.1 3'(2'),5'-bisphosphate nucleotidase CysQ [Candidatus Neomarinimicrobiota bacterium]|tara:strand:- start:2162 stop:2941 length:780 start_codon:yes stop_codon:yes gene_type:complete
MNPDLSIAQAAALEAGNIILNYYKADYEIRDKGYHNPVTTADHAADSRLKEILMAACPDYGWLSEETVDSKERLTKERVWVVDPLDGTKEFIEGIPHFVVSIALVEQGIPVIGVLYNPVTQETFTAAKGTGAYLNDKSITCATKDDVGEMVILNSRSETRRGLWSPYDGTFGELRAIGSVAYKLGLTAAGKADIFASLRPKNEWDICAGNCIINEAGGKLIDLKGNHVSFNQEKTLIEPGLIAGDINAVDKTFNILTAN